jgi:hypothetical protein
MRERNQPYGPAEHDAAGSLWKFRLDRTPNIAVGSAAGAQGHALRPNSGALLTAISAAIQAAAWRSSAWLGQTDRRAKLTTHHLTCEYVLDTDEVREGEHDRPLHQATGMGGKRPLHPSLPRVELF